MNRINPIYITLLLGIILVVVIYQNHTIQQTITQKELSLHSLEQKAKEIATLKKYWGDKKIQRARVLQLLNTPFIKRFIKNQQKSGDRYRVLLHKIDALNADRIADKILNSFVKVGSFSIQKTSKTEISMEVEFRF